MTEQNLDSSYLTQTFTGLQNYRNGGGVNSIIELYDCNSLIQKIVDTYPDQAYATGVELNGKSTESETEYLNSLGFYESFQAASVYARLHGKSAILMGVADGDDLSQPVLSGAPVRWLKVYPLTQDEPDDNECYLIGEELCHKSRLLLFYGKRIYKQGSKGNIIATGISVLAGVEDLLVSYLENIPYLPKLIKISNQMTLGTKGLSASIKRDIIAKKQDYQNEIMSRLNSFNLGRDVANTGLYDLENEKVDNVSMSLNGISELMQELELALAFHLDYPRQILFERGNSTGLQSSTNAQIINRMEWAKALSTWIDSHWTKNTEILLKMLGFTSQVSVPLAIQLTDLELAEIDEKRLANIEKIHDASIMSDEEYRQIVSRLMPDLELSPTLPVIVPKVAPVVNINNAVNPPLESAANTDSTLTDLLNDFVNITPADVESTMTRIGEQSV